MLQSYLDEGLLGPATFELFARTLPEQRNYLLVCGLDDALCYLETLALGTDALAALERLGFPARFLEPAAPPCPVEVSAALRADEARLRAALNG